MSEDPLFSAAQQRLVDAMGEAPKNADTAVVLDMVSLSSTLVPLFLHEFEIEADAVILSKKQHRELLERFANRLLLAEVEWFQRRSGYAED